MLCCYWPLIVSYRLLCIYVPQPVSRQHVRAFPALDLLKRVCPKYRGMFNLHLSVSISVSIEIKYLIFHTSSTSHGSDQSASAELLIACWYSFIRFYDCYTWTRVELFWYLPINEGVLVCLYMQCVVICTMFHYVMMVSPTFRYLPGSVRYRWRGSSSSNMRIRCIATALPHTPVP
mgnify:CR=1 FL=1